MVYTTEWQEVVIALGHQDETTWEGLLKDIQLSFVLERAEASQAGDVVYALTREGSLARQLVDAD